MPSRKKTTSKRSIHPAPKQVTYLYDRHLPVSLRLRGLGVQPTIARPERSVSVQRAQHVSSPHVLALRPELEVTPQAATPAQVVTPKPAPDFDTFAHEFFKHLAASDETPSSEEVLEPSLLSGQLGEDDTNKAKTSLGLSRVLKNVPVPRLRTEAIKEIHDDLVELSDLIEEEVEVVVRDVKKQTKNLNLPHLRLPKMTLPKLSLPSFKHTPLPNPLLHPSLRGVSVFVLLSFVFVLPLQAMNSRSSAQLIKANLENESAQALALFEEAADASSRTDFALAKDQFAAAGTHLSEAQETLDTLGIGTKALAAILPTQGRTLKTGQALLDLGYELSVSAERVSDGLIAIGNLTDTSLGTKVEVLERYLGSALPHLSAATEALDRIDPEVIPEEHQGRFEELLRTLPELESNLHRLESFSGALKTILGNDEKKRYLFVFQNDTEIRPSGGFIGSFAEIDIYRGEVERVYLPGDGSYNLQGALGLHVAAPTPLSLINARWEFQDANWFPDFKASAQKLLQFHEAAGGPTVDGVIAINARFVADLLNILGPIDMPDYNRTITADNFLLETQTLVEVEYDREENKPKQFLSDLAPQLLERVQNSQNETFIPLLESLHRGLSQKDIQLYFTDTQAQEQTQELGWSGELTDADNDYLMVVNANIGGQKTDAVISETVDVDSFILADGRIQNTVTITRHHHGIPGAIFTGANNVNYVQLFVPRGSRLLHVEGSDAPDAALFEQPDGYLEEDPDLAFMHASAFKDLDGTDVSEAFGKTIFGNWTQTKPGQESQITFTYELPWVLSWENSSPGFFERAGDWLGLSEPEDHSLTIESQSGMRERTVNVSISFPPEHTPRWTTDLVENSQVTTTIEGAQNGFIGLLFE